MVSNKDVAIAFAEHRKKTSLHVFTDGNVIYSHGYHFPMAAWFYPHAIGVLLNTDKYSRSTSKQQSILRNILFQKGIKFTPAYTARIVQFIEDTDAMRAIHKLKEVAAITEAEKLKKELKIKPEKPRDAKLEKEIDEWLRGKRMRA